LDDYLGHLREFRRILQNLEGQPAHPLNREAIVALSQKLDRDESQLNADRLEHSIRNTVDATRTLEDLEHYEQDVMAVFHEITTKKRRDLERERFRKLLDQSGESILVVEPYTGRFLDVNQTASRALGYSREELLELSLNHIEVGLPLTPASAWHDWVEGIRKGHEVIYLEGVHRRRDGSRFPVEASIGFAAVDNEELLLLVTRDITERKRVENRLRRQWGFFSRLVYKSVDGIMAFDRSFNVTYWNPAMERILGIRKDKILGKNAFKALPQLKELGEDRYFRDALAGTTSTSRNRAFTHGETGHRVYFDGHYSPLTEGGGEILGGIGIFRDVSDRRETQLRQARDAMARVEQQRVAELEVRQRHQGEIEELKEENAKLAVDHEHSEAERAEYLRFERVEGLELFAKGVACAVEPLMAGILSQTGVALAELPAGSPLRKGVEEIEERALDVSALATLLSSFSGNGQVDGQRVRLDSVVDDLEHSLRSLTRPDVAVELERPSSGSLPLVRGDERLIRDLVLALVTNASESIGNDGGTVSISTGTTEIDAAALARAYLGKGKKPGSYVYLEVSDNGLGMDADTLAKSFVPFFTTKPEHQGLGLATVLGVMRAHRGAVTFDSELEKGSSVRVLFPAS